MFNHFIAGIHFSRQNLTSLDVRTLSSKVDPRSVRVHIFIMVVDPYHRYSNESERQTFMMISNCNKPIGHQGFYKKNQNFKGLYASGYIQIF